VLLFFQLAHDSLPHTFCCNCSHSSLFTSVFDAPLSLCFLPLSLLLFALHSPFVFTRPHSHFLFYSAHMSPFWSLICSHSHLSSRQTRHDNPNECILTQPKTSPHT
jgi:hypothetical protein